MAEKGKPQEEESSAEGAPLWIISFADMISLLMAFFVMLSSFSSFGPRESETLKSVARLTVTPNYGWHGRFPQSALHPSLVAAGDGATGSEKPTLEAKSNDKSMKETLSTDYKLARVFVTESSKIFWAKGQTVSTEGQRLLDLMAAYFDKMPGQIVIYENGPTEDFDLSIARCAVVIDQLQQRGIPKDRCNISARTMLEDTDTVRARQLEIVLADEVSYR